MFQVVFSLLNDFYFGGCVLLGVVIRNVIDTDCHELLIFPDYVVLSIDSDALRNLRETASRHLTGVLWCVSLILACSFKVREGWARSGWVEWLGFVLTIIAAPSGYHCLCFCFTWRYLRSLLTWDPLLDFSSLSISSNFLFLFGFKFHLNLLLHLSYFLCWMQCHCIVVSYDHYHLLCKVLCAFAAHQDVVDILFLDCDFKAFVCFRKGLSDIRHEVLQTFVRSELWNFGEIFVWMVIDINFVCFLDIGCCENFQPIMLRCLKCVIENFGDIRKFLFGRLFGFFYWALLMEGRNALRTILNLKLLFFFNFLSAY